MNGQAWPEIRQGRLGAGVVLDARALWALRVGADPDHERVARRVVLLAESGLPLIVSYLSLAEVAVRLQTEYGASAAVAVQFETKVIGTFNMRSKAST